MRIFAFFLIFCVAMISPVGAGVLEIEVVGKASVRHTISDSHPLFSALLATQTRVGDEVEYQLHNIDGYPLNRLYYLNVDRDLFMSLEGTSAFGFEFGVRALGFSTGAELHCPPWICPDFDVYITVEDMIALGAIDYSAGTASLQVQPSDPSVVITSGGILGGVVDRLTERVERRVESELATALQLVDIETQTFGLVDILGSLPLSLKNLLGVDPLHLLRNPIEGVLVDIAVRPPIGFSVPGQIEMEIAHRRPLWFSGTSVDNGLGGRSPRLAWASVPGAESYHIFRKSDGNPYWERWVTTTANQWTDTTVSADALHVRLPDSAPWVAYYVVSQNDRGIQSAPTHEVWFDLEFGSGSGPGGGFVLF